MLEKYSSTLKTENGLRYRDLNKNGRLDPYEDPRRSVDARVADLLGQMTLPEKAGLLFINGVAINPDGSLDPYPDPRGLAGEPLDMLNRLGMNHFNLWQIPSAARLASWQNLLQQAAESSRLGIPVTLASDPRNHIGKNVIAHSAQDFSQWCETLGFGAIGDEDLVRHFAEIVRREYLAVGIRVALHPQIDLATEPRWARISGNFSEDAGLTARLGAAYIRGLQGGRLGPDSVACMTKHFPGGGPQKDGLDPHFEFHQGQVYPGGNFDYHLVPFEAAIEAGTAAIMPYYGVPVDQTDENVAMAFNKAIITGLLREKYGYDGIVCTDWGLITDKDFAGTVWPACAWGVQHLSETGRVLKALEAGVDQFGGESRPELVVELVESGRLSETRLDVSVKRLLRQKFQLGLFDDPYVEQKAVDRFIGRPESIAKGYASQQQALTLLKNEDHILPLSGSPKLFVKNMDAETAGFYAQVVPSPEDADLAILRLETPWYPVDTQNAFARMFHHGDLDFKGAARAEILDLLNTVPTIVVIYLDRPAVIPEISAHAKGLLADYGATDRAVLDVLFGNSRPEGRLPFELPSSMEAVRNQRSDMPSDSKDPLYPFGYGLSYQ